MVGRIPHHKKCHVQVKALPSGLGGEYVPGHPLFEGWICIQNFCHLIKRMSLCITASDYILKHLFRKAKLIPRVEFKTVFGGNKILKMGLFWDLQLFASCFIRNLKVASPFISF